MRRGLLWVGIVLGWATGAQSADIMASAPLFASATKQKTVVCNFLNSGDVTLQLTNVSIIASNGNTFGLSANTCSSGLASRHSCSATGTVNGLPFSCIAFVSPSKANMRGNMEMRDADGAVLQTTGIR